MTLAFTAKEFEAMVRPGWVRLFDPSRDEWVSMSVGADGSLRAQMVRMEPMPAPEPVESVGDAVRRLTRFREVEF